MSAERIPLPVRPPVSEPAPSPVPAAPPARPPLISVREYLDSEREANTRHEYVDGVILAMAGETLNHNRIAGNVYRHFGNQFENVPCDAFIENIRVRVTPTQYRYPDVAALCGEAELDDESPPCLLNPAVLVEVLSPSTEDKDRREKFIEYRELASVTDYILISQTKVQVTHYTRHSELQWTVTTYQRREDVLTLNAVNVSLPVADIYRKIVFDAPTSS